MKSAEEKYWDSRGLKFIDLYANRNIINRLFRQQVYLRKEIAVRECRGIPGATVLDAGCGAGVVMKDLIERGDAKYVLGLDISANMLARARERLTGQISDGKCELLQADFMSHEFGESRFDIVIALGVFDYIAEHTEFLRKMVSLAKRTIVASFPGGGLRMRLRRGRYPIAVYPYTLQQIIKMHRDAGAPDPEYRRSSGGYITVTRLDA